MIDQWLYPWIGRPGKGTRMDMVFIGRLSRVAYPSELRWSVGIHLGIELPAQRQRSPHRSDPIFGVFG